MSRPNPCLRFSGLRFAAVVSCWLVASSQGDTFAAEPRREHLLFQAIRRGDLDLLKSTLQGGAPADTRAEDGTTPLMAAALYGGADMVKLLIQHGADPRATNADGVTALLWGAWDLDQAKLLTDHGADPNARSKLGNTPLMVAAASPAGSPSVELLLDRGADLTLRSSSGRTALRAAAAGGDIRTVRLLLDKARDLGQLDAVVRGAGPAVAIAAGSGFDQIVDLLLAAGADPNLPNGSRGHGLNAALLAGETGIARRLIERGSDFHLRIQPGDVPTSLLAVYSETDDTSILDMLQAHGADLKAASGEGETALTWARLRGHRQLIDRLVAAGIPEGKLPSRPSGVHRSLDQQASPGAPQIVEAVQKSIDLLQRSSDTFLDVRRNCVSCHHQNLPGVALAWARDRRFRVRQESLDRMTERQVASWEPRIGRSYELDSPYPVPPSFLGYGMWTFAELGYRPNELTRAVVWYLAATQQPDGHWVPGMLRPPLGGEAIQATALALRSLRLYPLPGREAEMARRVGLARTWLAAAQPKTHQEIVYRMLGLQWAGGEAGELPAARQQLLDTQRTDGGWAQLPSLESDAYATGQSLVALHVAGGLPTDHPAYRRGAELLLKTQSDDGSWYVQTRSWPFQPYFESDFPYGRDQWISASATAWSVMALVLAVQPADVARLQTGEATTSAAGSAAPSASQTPAAVPESRAGKNSPVELVAPVKRLVDFGRDIRPILARSCAGCHGDRDAESNFSVTSRQALLKGGDSDLPAVVPGVSQDSPLVRFAAGAVEKLEMPPRDARDKFPPLTADELALLRGWIDQGAVWPADVKFSQDGK